MTEDSELLLTEASLCARQLPKQLPELRESQLPVVVFIQWAHELVDGSRITGVLCGGGGGGGGGDDREETLIIIQSLWTISYSERLSCHLMAEERNK